MWGGADRYRRNPKKEIQAQKRYVRIMAQKVGWKVRLTGELDRTSLGTRRNFSDNTTNRVLTQTGTGFAVILFDEQVGA
jgi:hypothetical protein